jgi:Spy/CpxP family protein refolding chaperone
MLNRTKLWAIALLVGVFAAGFAAGAAVDVAAWGGREGRDRSEQRDERRNRSYLDRLQAELTLTPVQRDTIKGILGRYQGAMHEIWTDVRPKVDAVRAAVRADILSVLDSIQQDQYRAIIARSDSSRRGERGREGNREH